MASPDHRRIVVLGTTGAGKTVLAQQLSAALGFPHIELDALRWDADWTDAGDEVFRSRIADAVSGNSWVVDGNYSIARDLVWPKATMVVWLDYPLGIVLWRLLRRTLRRVATGEELWNGNRERFANAFFRRDSLFAWAIKTHGRRRRTYPPAFAEPQHSHLEVVRLRSLTAAEHWLAWYKTRLRPSRLPHNTSPLRATERGRG